MSAVAVAKKKHKVSEDKVEFRAETALIERIDAQARRKGLSRSAYVRMVMMEHLDRVEGERPARQE